MDDLATVLLVDDDPGFADTAAAFVERASDAITTTTATTPGAALDRFEAGDIDCVVSDYNMPEMDGLALFETVSEREPGIPFVLFTGKGSEEVASEAISLGVTDYLQKETGTDQYAVLANRIENAIEARRAERRLERSEERYQHLVESSPAGILITTLEDRVVYANEAAAAFIGADDPEEFHGKSTLDLVHPDDEATLRERWEGSREREPQQPIEERFVGFDGETRHAVVASTPVTYEGEPAVQSVLTDITEQRRAERELREEREFTEHALDALDDTFFVTDPSGQLSRWNDRFTTVTGYNDEAIDQMYPQDFVGGGDEGQIADAFDEVIETGRTTVEVTIETKSGEQVPYELVAATMTDDDGTILGVCGIGRDITERRERERDLERYERLVETVDDALYTVDSEGQFTFVNDSFVDLTGHDRASVIGSDVSILKDEATVERFENAVGEMLSGDHDETYIEFDLEAASGDTIPCEDHMVLRTDEGAYAGVTGVIRDATERTRRERDLERYETAIEAAPVGVFVIDSEGTIRWTNDRAASSVGHTVEELAETPFDDLIEAGIVAESAAEGYATLVDELLSADADRTMGRYEVSVTHPEDGERTMRVHLSLLPSEEGFRGAVLVSEDVTERKRREEALERERDRLRALFENVPDAVYRYEAEDDEQGRIRAVNPAFESTFGYEGHEVLDQRIAEAIVPDDRVNEHEEVAERAETGDPVNREVERATATGTRTFLFRNAAMASATEENGTAGYAIYTDITERKRHEREIAKQNARREALHSVALDLVSCRSEQEIYDRTVEAAEHILDFEMCYLGIVEGNAIVPRARSAHVGPDHFRTMDIDEGVAGKSIREGSSYLIEDVATVTDAEPTREEYRSAISVPIGEIGVFQAASNHTGGFDETDRELAETLLATVRASVERLRRENALERERERFVTLFENIPEPAVFVNHEDGEATIRAVNHAFETTFGYDAEAAVGELLNDLIVPPERREEATRIDEAVTGGEQVVREVTRRTAAGEDREFLFSNATIEENRTEGFGVYTDITTQKRRERVLADLHDRTREMMATDDPETIASIAVEAAADVLGLPMAGIWLHDEDTATLRPAAITDGGGSLIEEIPIYEPGNSLSWEAFATGESRVYESIEADDAYNAETPIRSEMIFPLGAYGVMNVGNTTADEFDETDEALARLLATNVEAALDRAEREQDRAAHRRLLERENQRLEAFASVVSHDLRNPLTVAIGRLELLAEETDSQHAPAIADALSRIDDLIEECLVFARQGQVVTDPTPTEVETVTERAWRTVETGETQLSVEALGTVEADEDRLRTVFENLFRNAIEHGDATTIRVELLDEGPGIAVVDDGSGIPDSERESVFERGYSTSPAGTGLGLAIVETLVEAHGWEIRLADSGSGARFEVAFEPTDPLPVDRSSR